MVFKFQRNKCWVFLVSTPWAISALIFVNVYFRIIFLQSTFVHVPPPLFTSCMVVALFSPRHLSLPRMAFVDVEHVFTQCPAVEKSQHTLTQCPAVGMSQSAARKPVDRSILTHFERFISYYSYSTSLFLLFLKIGYKHLKVLVARGGEMAQ